MARYTEEDAPADNCHLGQRIEQAIQNQGATSVEIVKVGHLLKLRIWDWDRADQSNSENANPNQDY